MGRALERSGWRRRRKFFGSCGGRAPIADCCGGMGGHGASYLGPEHDGVQLSADPKNPLPFAAPGREVPV